MYCDRRGKCLWSHGNRYPTGPFVSAKDDTADILEGEDDGNVEEEPSPTDALSGSPTTADGESEPDDSTSLKSHPDADTHFLITKPIGMGLGNTSTLILTKF